MALNMTVWRKKYKAVLLTFSYKNTNAFLAVYPFVAHYCWYISFPNDTIFSCVLSRMALLLCTWQLKRTTLRWWNISWRMEPTKAQLPRWGGFLMFFFASVFRSLEVRAVWAVSRGFVCVSSLQQVVISKLPFRIKELFRLEQTSQIKSIY